MNFFTRIMRKFFVRTFMVYAGIIVLVFLSIYFFAQGTVKTFYYDNLKIHLNQLGYALTPKAAELYQVRDFKGLDALTGLVLNMRRFMLLISYRSWRLNVH